MQKAFKIFIRRKTIQHIFIYENTFVVRKVFETLSQHYDAYKITIMVSESLGNTVHVWGRFYFQSAFLCTLRMIPSGPLIEGYNGALTAFVTVSYASLTYRVRFRQLHLLLLLPAHSVGFWHIEQIKSSARVLQNSLWLCPSALLQTPSLSLSSSSLCDGV